MTIDALHCPLERGRDSSPESGAIGLPDTNIFLCPRCSRPLAVGVSRCAGCGTRLVAGVPLLKVSGFVGKPLVVYFYPKDQIPPHRTSKFTIECDTVVLAIGYWPDTEIGEVTPGLETHKFGLVRVETEETGRTSRPGVFAGGDNVRGADLVVTAIAAARNAARSMDAYLGDKMRARDVNPRTPISSAESAGDLAAD